jgi:hypothetical protein
VSCSVEASGSQQVVSPECIRPFPTAQPRKTNRKRLGKSRILTDTPVKNEISQQKRRNETDVHKRKSLKKKSRQNCRKKLKYNSTVDATSSLFKLSPIPHVYTVICCIPQGTSSLDSVSGKMHKMGARCMRRRQQKTVTLYMQNVCMIDSECAGFISGFLLNSLVWPSANCMNASA